MLNGLGARARAVIRRTTTPKLRAAVRSRLARVDDPEIRHARLLVKRLKQRRPPAALHLGDSVSSFISPDDRDQRTLSQMIRDELSAVGDFQAIAGPGYHPGLYEAYLRLFRGSEARPLVVFPLGARGGAAIYYEHPVYGYKPTLDALRRIDPTKPARQIRGRMPKPTREDFENYYRLPHPTLLGDLTVGDYLRPLRDGSLGPEERVRYEYAYNQGGKAVPDSPHIRYVTELGLCLRELGFPTVSYQLPICVAAGVEALGPEFEARTAENIRLIDDAYLQGRGPDGSVLQTGTTFERAEFIDPADGTEHLNEVGRIRLARLIGEAGVQELEKQ